MEKKSSNFRKSFTGLLSFLRPYRKTLILSVVLTVCSAVFSSLGPFLLGRATDSLVDLATDDKFSSEGVSKLAVHLTLFAVTYLLYAGLKFLGSKILVHISQRTIYDLREKIDLKLKKLPLRYFDSNPYGEILSRITNDVDTVSNNLQQILDQLVSSVTSLFFIFLMMLIINPVLTFISIVSVPLSLFVTMKIAKSSQSYFREQQRMIGSLNAYVEEIYTGHIVVSAFNMQKKSLETFKEKNEELYRSARKAQFRSTILMPITESMNNLGYIAIVVTGGWLVIQGRMSVGMIQSFLQYLRQFSQPILQTVQISNLLQSTSAAAERVFEFLNEEEEVPDPFLSTLPSEFTVEFDHVRFGYSPESPLMKDVNIRIEAGKKVAIVGPTGAGKTTLVNLLLRFYDIDGGNILIGGVDIRSMKRKELREIFGMVLQDTWLFTGSIMENIRYGKLDSTDEEVIQAAKNARADSFINSLPEGYHFKLQENASNLAQGERQLLTIARAILANNPIMILDEATSSVDTRTEVLIQEAMVNLMEGRTSFVIAHRLSTIRDADIILYMENGDIKEMGSHFDLITKGGRYASLYQSQFSSENQE